MSAMIGTSAGSRAGSSAKLTPWIVSFVVTWTYGGVGFDAGRQVGVAGHAHEALVLIRPRDRAPVSLAASATALDPHAPVTT